MKLPTIVSKLVARRPRLLALAAATASLPIGSYLLPFWHDCESILAVIYLFVVLVIVDHKVQGDPWADFH